eukprot:gene12867-15112_t
MSSMKARLLLRLVSKSWMKAVDMAEMEKMTMRIQLDEGNIEEYMEHIDHQWSVLSACRRWYLDFYEDSIDPLLVALPKVCSRATTLRLCIGEWTRYDLLAASLAPYLADYRHELELEIITIKVEDYPHLLAFINSLNTITTFTVLAIEEATTTTGHHDTAGLAQSLSRHKLQDLSLDLSPLPAESRNELTRTLCLAFTDSLTRIALNILQLGDNKLFNHLATLQHLRTFIFDNKEATVDSNVSLFRFLMANNTISRIQIRNPVCPAFVRLLLQSRRNLHRAGLNINRRLALPSALVDSLGGHIDKLSKNDTFRRLTVYLG